MELRTPSCRERSHDVSSDDNNQREDLIEKMEGGFSETEREGWREGEREYNSDETSGKDRLPVQSLR